MNAITVLKGLPASGKTTLAKELLALGLPNKGHAIRVNKDDLRAMLHGGEYSTDRESFVILARDAIIRLALENNLDVIVDDTNLNPKHLEDIAVIAAGCQAELNTIEMVTSLNECIQRDSQRDKPVGEAVIREMYEKYMTGD